MKRRIITLAAAAALALLLFTAGCTADRQASSQATAAASRKVVSAVCPVMGNKIPDVTKAVAKSTYKGKTYYFCCKGCKPLFDKNPEKYIKKSARR